MPRTVIIETEFVCVLPVDAFEDKLADVSPETQELLKESDPMWCEGSGRMSVGCANCPFCDWEELDRDEL